MKRSGAGGKGESRGLTRYVNIFLHVFQVISRPEG